MSSAKVNHVRMALGYVEDALLDGLNIAFNFRLSGHEISWIVPRTPENNLMFSAGSQLHPHEAIDLLRGLADLIEKKCQREIAP